MTRAPLGCATALLLACASCGGGGGSTSDGGTPSLAPLLAITDSNAQAVAASVWLGSTVSTASEVLSAPLPKVLETYFGFLALRPNGLPVDVACEISGTARLDGGVADAAQPGMSAGDRITVVYQRCLENDDSLIAVMNDGTLAVQVTASDAQARTFSVAYQALRQGIAASQLFTQQGSATFTLSRDGASAWFATERLSATSGPLSVTIDHFTQSFTASGAGHLLVVRGTRSGGDLAGSVTVDTPTPLHVPSGGFPDAGELVITGAAGSSVALRPEPDGVHVLLVVNGGAPVETTWNELEG